MAKKQKARLVHHLDADIEILLTKAQVKILEQREVKPTYQDLAKEIGGFDLKAFKKKLEEFVNS